MARSRKKTTLSPAALGVVVVFGVIGAIANACGGEDNAGTPAGYSVPAYVTSSDPTPTESSEPPATEEPAASSLPSDTEQPSAQEPLPTGAEGSGGADLNPPGNGYVSGPGVNCGLSGCHVHGPHIGRHR